MESIHDVVITPDTLPLEIIFMIIESIIEKDQKEILPSSHEGAKTLLAFSRVCRATYRRASTLLWAHCVHLNSRRKCESFLASLEGRSVSERPWLASVPTKLFLRPYAEKYNEPIFREPPDKRIQPLESFQGCYIDPDYLGHSNLNDCHTVYLVRNILMRLAPTLQKLVIDIWLSEESSPLQDKIRLVLREGLEALENLEEFVSLRDSLGLGPSMTRRHHPPIRSEMWPRLRRLGVFHPGLIYNRLPTGTLHESIWGILAGFRYLETVVFAHSQDFPGVCRGDVKYDWAKATAADRSEEYPFLVQRPLKIIFIDVHDHRLQHHTNPPEFGWACDPENLVRTVCVSMSRKPPIIGTTNNTVNGAMRNPTNRINRCQDWVKGEALSGSLWDISEDGYIEPEIDGEKYGTGIPSFPDLPKPKYRWPKKRPRVGFHNPES